MPEMTEQDVVALKRLMLKAGLSNEELEKAMTKPKRKQPQASRYKAVKSQVEKVESYHLHLFCTCTLCGMTWEEKWWMQRQKVKEEYGLLAKKLHNFPRITTNLRKGKMKRLTCHCCERRLMAFVSKRGLVRGLILERREKRG